MFQNKTAIDKSGVNKAQIVNLHSLSCLIPYSYVHWAWVFTSTHSKTPLPSTSSRMGFAFDFTSEKISYKPNWYFMGDPDNGWSHRTRHANAGRRSCRAAYLPRKINILGRLARAGFVPYLQLAWTTGLVLFTAEGHKNLEEGVSGNSTAVSYLWSWNSYPTRRHTAACFCLWKRRGLFSGNVLWSQLNQNSSNLQKPWRT